MRGCRCPVWPFALLVALAADAASAQAPGKRVALFVGINSYDKPAFADLPGAENDAKALAAEFQKLGFDTHVVIHPDLPIHLVRPLIGEWVGLRARSLYADDGVGMSDTELHDERGPVGRSNQSLLLDRH